MVRKTQCNQEMRTWTSSTTYENDVDTETEGSGYKIEASDAIMVKLANILHPGLCKSSSLLMAARTVIILSKQKLRVQHEVELGCTVPSVNQL